MSAKPRGKYGLDAPDIVMKWAGTAAAAGVGAWLLGRKRTWWSSILAGGLGLFGASQLAGAGLHAHASLRGKYLVWRDLLADLSLPASARILDLGCGRGAVSIMAAQRFPDASVTGVDIWRTVDQFGNSPNAAARNVELNKATSRVHFDTQDMTSLNYPDSHFDLVLASLSLHNIATMEGRRTALLEAIRVLADDGQLVIVDILYTDEYAAELRNAGFSVSGPEDLGWRTWWTGPWIGTSALIATR